jgi:endonuclease VIII-like 1
MPELAELKIMSEYINKSSKGRIFINLRKSVVSKVKTSMKMPFDAFQLSAISRGKELKLKLISKEGEDVNLMCSMGMSGNWTLTRTGEEQKHSHLMFDTLDGFTLSLVDVRRFAKWKWGDWNKGRGADPTYEYQEFVDNIYKNIEHRSFQKEISEVLLDQKWFNGIGNYLRSTILYYADQSPWATAKDAILQNPKLLELCRDVPLRAYQMSGGQLKDWANPFNKPEDKVSFREWVFYYKGSSCIDGAGRRLWFDPKWESTCPYELKGEKEEETFETE